jgi:hypothetical protein
VINGGNLLSVNMAVVCKNKRANNTEQHVRSISTLLSSQFCSQHEEAIHSPALVPIDEATQLARQLRTDMPHVYIGYAAVVEKAAQQV